MKRMLAMILAIFVCTSCRGPQQVTREAGSDYVDSALCASCHTEIAKTYERTGMGRSFFRPSPANTVEDFKNKNTYYHAASDRYYTMVERDGRYFQRRHQLGPDGGPANMDEKEIHYIIGSGNHVRTYLHLNTQKKLVELPVAWYSENGGYWAMNPGYDRPDHQDFRRTVGLECMFCHNAYPESEALLPEKTPEGIDCQRCHGPGGAHVRTAEALGSNPETIKKAIVNPARLSPERKLEVCMQCHLESTSTRLPYSLRRFNRGVFSFRPGEALADYVIHFDHAAGSGRDDKFEIVNQAYRLRKSACFQKSSGALTCTTCHDPHSIPRGEEATRHYVSVCQGCHETLNAKHASSRDCLSCHMPKRRTDDVVHVVMTDHYIQRRKPSRGLLAPLQERHDENPYKGPVALYYPPDLPPTTDNELYLALAQVKQNSNLEDGIARLKAALGKNPQTRGEFYFEMGEAYWEERKPELAIPMYQQALERLAEFWPALHKLGLSLAKTGQSERAAGFLERASAHSTDAAVLNDLALVYRQTGKINEALATLRKAVSLDPDLPQAHNNLGGLLRETGDLPGAENAFRQSIRAQPDFAAAQTNLANVLMRRQDFSGAQYHLEQAIRQRRDPAVADARNALGDLLGLQGQAERAAVQYREALKIDPNLASAHFSLGSILAVHRKKSEALQHLQRAAQSSDPSIREPALKAMQQLGR
jgi:predicted CXXCH cytochrome family protein